MFEKFTDMSREAVVRARELATKYKHLFIGTEHLLFGLVAVEDGIASKAIASFDLNADKIKDKIIEFLGDNGGYEGANRFTPRVQRVFELAVKESLKAKSKSIGTEHMLLAILREGEGVAVKILAEFSIAPSQLTKAIYALIEKPDLSNPSEAFSMAGAGANNTLSGNQLLDKFGRNLTQAAQEGKLDPVIGRKTEVERILQILSRRTKNNPILIGEPGVGKTAVVEGLAQAIVQGNIPENLQDKQVYTLDLGSMVAGTQFRGMFEDRLKKVIGEVIKRGNVILFIDEIHTLIGAGNAEGSLDAASILKPMLARGELQTIGATTLEEYRKHFEKDSALERRFQPIKVDEPSIDDAIEILRGLRERYEAFHNATFSDEAIEAAVKLSSRYVNDRFLPDKAIDLLDEAGARLNISRMTAPENVRELKEQIVKKQTQKDIAVKAEDFETAEKLKSECEAAEALYQSELEKWKEDQKINNFKVDEDAIAKILEMSTGIPVFKMNEEETKRLLQMETELHNRVVGQEEAIKALSKSIRRTRAGLKDPKRPGGSFIFAGPTGVGKTELAKALAEFLFGDDKSLIQLDMSEYSEKHTVSRLFGAPPGFVGYDDGGQLTEKVRRKPFSVVLFDEIEKAHPDIFNTLLQVLEDGHLTDSTGRVVDFKNTVIIMTTNLGSTDVNRGLSVGFADENDDVATYSAMQNKVKEALKRDFKPEFLNRLDDVIVFPQLKKSEILQIVDLMIANVQKRLDEREITLELTPKAKEMLMVQGYDQTLGARPLRRTITKLIEDELSEKILFGEVTDFSKVIVDSDGAEQTSKLSFKVEKSAKKSKTEKDKVNSEKEVNAETSAKNNNEQ